MTIFKSGSLPNTWQNLVEFRSVTSDDGVRKQRKRIRAKYNGFPCIRMGGHKMQ